MGGFFVTCLAWPYNLKLHFQKTWRGTIFLFMFCLVQTLLFMLTVCLFSNHSKSFFHLLGAHLLALAHIRMFEKMLNIHIICPCIMAKIRDIWQQAAHLPDTHTHTTSMHNPIIHAQVRRCMALWVLWQGPLIQEPRPPAMPSREVLPYSPALLWQKTEYTLWITEICPSAAYNYTIHKHSNIAK